MIQHCNNLDSFTIYFFFYSWNCLIDNKAAIKLLQEACSYNEKQVVTKWRKPTMAEIYGHL